MSSWRNSPAALKTRRQQVCCHIRAELPEKDRLCYSCRVAAAVTAAADGGGQPLLTHHPPMGPSYANEDAHGNGAETGSCDDVSVCFELLPPRVDVSHFRLFSYFHSLFWVMMRGVMQSHSVCVSVLCACFWVCVCVNISHTWRQPEAEIKSLCPRQHRSTATSGFL